AMVSVTGKAPSSSFRHSTVAGCPRSASIVGPGTVPAKPQMLETGRSRWNRCSAATGATGAGAHRRTAPAAASSTVDRPVEDFVRAVERPVEEREPWADRRGADRIVEDPTRERFGIGPLHQEDDLELGEVDAEPREAVSAAIGRNLAGKLE